MISETQKRSWIKALESNLYDQGFGQLFHERTKRYCALGVFAEINNFFNDGKTNETGIGTVNKQNVSLPSNILIQSIQDQIVNLNHKQRMSFADIAIWISSNIPVKE